MRTITKNLYKFEELEDESKERAIKNYRERNDLYFEGEMLEEDMNYKLSEYGYKNMEVNFSLTYSQGDGVAFYGTISGEDFEYWLKIHKKEFTRYELKKIKDERPFIQINITRTSMGYHYSHYNTMDVEVYVENYEDNEVLQRIQDKIYEIVDDEIRDISKELENQGYAYFEECQSDEYITEDLIINEFEFDEYGHIY